MVLNSCEPDECGWLSDWVRDNWGAEWYGTVAIVLVLIVALVTVGFLLLVAWIFRRPLDRLEAFVTRKIDERDQARHEAEMEHLRSWGASVRAERESKLRDQRDAARLAGVTAAASFATIALTYKAAGALIGRLRR